MNPRYGIPQLSFPMESHCELFNAFSPEECQKILELGETLLFASGSVGNNVIVKETRDSTVAWIDDNPQAPNVQERRWLLDRIASTFARVNRDKFQLDLDGFQPMQYTKYALNQHYDWHNDTHEGMESDAHRKLSAVLMLAKPEDYEGGELELNLSGNPENTKLLKPAQGTVVFFYSHLPHRVKPVTSGDRISLVVWGLGPKLR